MCPVFAGIDLRFRLQECVLLCSSLFDKRAYSSYSAVSTVVTFAPFVKSMLNIDD